MARNLARELAELKAQVEEQRAEEQRAEGALREVMKELESKFGCNTIEAAEAELRRLERRAQKSEANFLEALDALRKDVMEDANGSQEAPP